MKRTTITCNRCGNYHIGENHAPLWRALKKAGWVKGEKQGVHYCPACANSAHHGQAAQLTDDRE